jgi:hypothetical protein
MGLGLRRWTIAGPLVGLVILLGALGAALANPIPNYIIYSHVQPVGGDFCGDLPINGCSGLVQSTTLGGPLEFDLFLWQYVDDPYWPCDSLLVPLEWPPDWSFVSHDVCGTTGASFTPSSGGGVLHVPSLEGYGPNPHWRGLLRVVLDVSSPGWFKILDVGDCVVFTTDVRAGLECGNCAWPCTWGPFGLYGASFPSLEPTELELRAETGMSAVGEIGVGLYDIQTGEHISYVSAESWLSLESRSIPPGYYDRAYEVTVTAHADSLDPGVYEGWVEVQRMRCSECARVVFTVVPSTGVQAETWGSVKNRYRVGSE